MVGIDVDPDASANPFLDEFVPNRLHPWLGGKLQTGMHEADTFPTRMRANTAWMLTRLCEDAGLDSQTTVHGGLSGYAAGRRRLQAALEMLECRLPGGMAHTIILSAAKVSA